VTARNAATAICSNSKGPGSLRGHGRGVRRGPEDYNKAGMDDPSLNIDEKTIAVMRGAGETIEVIPGAGPKW